MASCHALLGFLMLMRASRATDVGSQETKFETSAATSDDGSLKEETTPGAALAKHSLGMKLKRRTASKASLLEEGALKKLDDALGDKGIQEGSGDPGTKVSCLHLHFSPALEGSSECDVSNNMWYDYCQASCKSYALNLPGAKGKDGYGSGWWLDYPSEVRMKRWGCPGIPKVKCVGNGFLSSALKKFAGNFDSTSEDEKGFKGYLPKIVKSVKEAATKSVMGSWSITEGGADTGPTLAAGAQSAAGGSSWLKKLVDELNEWETVQNPSGGASPAQRVDEEIAAFAAPIEDTIATLNTDTANLQNTDLPQLQNEWGSQTAGIVKQLIDNINGAIVVAQEAKYESEEIIYAFLDDVMGEFEDFDTEDRENVLEAVQEYNTTTGPILEELQTDVGTLIQESLEDRTTIENRASSSLVATADLLDQQVASLWTAMTDMYTVADADLDTVQNTHIPEFTRIQSEEVDGVTGPDGSERHYRDELKSVADMIRNKLGEVQEDGKSELEQIMTTAKEVQTEMKQDAKSEGSRMQSRFDKIRRGPSSISTIRGLLNPLRSFMERVPTDINELISDAYAQLTQTISSAKAALDTEGKANNMLAEKQGSRHMGKLENAKKEVEDIAKEVLLDLKDKADAIDAQLTGDEKDIDGASGQAFSTVQAVVGSAAQYLKENGFDRNLVDTVLRDSNKAAGGALTSLQEQEQDAILANEAASAALERAEGDLTNEKTSGDARLRNDLDENGLAVTGAANEAAAAIEETIEGAEKGLSGTFVQQPLPRSTPSGRTAYELETLYSRLTNETEPLGRFVEDTIENSTIQARDRFLAENHRAGLFVDAALKRSAEVAGRISNGVAKSLVKEDDLRKFIEKKTQNGYLGIESDWGKELREIQQESEYVKFDMDKLDHDENIAKQAGGELVGGVVKSALAFQDRMKRSSISLRDEIAAETDRLRSNADAIMAPLTISASDNISAIGAAYLDQLAGVSATAGDKLSEAAGKVEREGAAEIEDAGKAAAEVTAVGDELDVAHDTGETLQSGHAVNLDHLISDVASIRHGVADDATDAEHRIEQGHADLVAGMDNARDAEEEKEQDLLTQAGGDVEEALRHFADEASYDVGELTTQTKSATARAKTATSWIQSRASKLLQDTERHGKQLEEGIYADAKRAAGSLADIRSLLHAAQKAVLDSGQESTGQLSSEMQILDGLMAQLSDVKTSTTDAIKEEAGHWQDKVRELIEEMLTSMTLIGTKVDKVAAEEHVTVHAANAAMADAQVDAQMADNARNESRRIFNARKLIIDQKVKDLDNYTTWTVNSAADRIQHTVRQDASDMGDIVDSIEELIKNVSGIMNSTEAKQKVFEDDIARVAQLETTDLHKQWIAENMDKAALVDFKATEFLQWVHRFAVRDRGFKELVRKKLESLNITISDELMKAIHAAHGAMTSEQDQRVSVHNNFETKMSEEAVRVRQMVGEVGASADEILQQIEASTSLTDEEKERLRKQLLTQTHTIEGSIQNTQGHDDAATDSLWYALQELRRQMKRAVSLGIDTQSMDNLFSVFASRIANITQAMNDVGLMGQSSELSGQDGRREGDQCGSTIAGDLGGCAAGLECVCVGDCANPNVTDAPSTCVRQATGTGLIELSSSEEHYRSTNAEHATRMEVKYPRDSLTDSDGGAEDSEKEALKRLADGDSRLERWLANAIGT